MRKYLISFISAITIAISLISCTNNPPMEQTTTTNGYNVQLLFEVDGIKVYKFKDEWNNVYFTNRPGEIINYHSTGKTTEIIYTECE